MRGKDILTVLSTLRSHEDELATTIIHPDDTVTIGKWCETGQYEMRSVRVGGAVVSLEVPVRDFMVVDRQPLQTQIEKDKKRQKQSDKQQEAFYAPWQRVPEESLLGRDDYRTWLEENALPMREDVIATARQLAIEHDGHENDTIPCSHCKGIGEYESGCMCQDLRSSITDRHFQTVYDREEGPDPNCLRCHGEGSYTKPCYTCGGVGSMPLYPEIIIDDPAMNQRHRLRLDGAQLITSCPEILENLSIYTQSPYDDEVRVEKKVRIKWSQAIALMANIRQLGDEVVYVRYGESGEYIREFDDLFKETVVLANHKWSTKHGDIPIQRMSRRSETAERTSPRQLLDTFQKNLAMEYRSRISQWGNLSYEVVYSVSPERRIQDLRSALGARGLGIALLYEFIATGETGPALYASRGDELVAPLAQHYVVEKAVEPAWWRYLEYVDELPTYPDASA